MLANFSNLITFSRGSNATVTDASGRLTYAPHNLLTNSQDFEASAWGKDRITVTANAEIAPDGTKTADAVVPTAVSGTHGFGIAPPVSIAAGMTYIASVYVKASGYNFFRFLIFNGSSNLNTYFNLSTGSTATVAAGVTASIQAVGNGWYRCVCLFTAAATATSSVFVVQPHVAPADGTVSFTGDGTSGIFIWGAQLEAVTYQTTPSPYVSTSVANLLGFSEAFDNAAWSKGNSAIVPGAAQNPINNLWNAQKLMENTANAAHNVLQTASLVSGTTYTISVYAKPAERSEISFYEASSTGARARFNVSTGTIVSVAGGGSPTAAIQSIGNGWYRCSMKFTAGLTGATNLLIYIGDVVSYTGDGNSGIYIYGAQLSNSGSLDPYVPTPGAAPSSTAYYGPRFDYDPVTLAPKGILIEEQRTNLLTLSENIAGAAWFVVNIASRTANTSTSPSGTVTAGTLTDDTTTARHVLYNTITLGSSGVYTFSVYLKQGTGRYVQVQLSAGSSATSIGVIADLLNGTITDTKIGASATNTASSITSFGNGWYRVSVTCQCASGTVFPIIAGSDSATPTYDAFFNPTYTGTGQTRLIWGAQLEAGAFATSYIPTVASQVTRTADVANITGSLFSQWFNPNEGAVVVEAVAARKEDFPVLTGYRTPGTASFLYVNSANAGSWNGSVAVSQTGGGIASGTTFKAAMTYSPTGRAVTSGGGAPASDSNTIGAAALLSLGMPGSGPGGGQVLNGYIRSIQYIPNAISNTQLQNITG